MKLASETTAGLWVPLVPPLDLLLARLDSLSSEPAMAAQRQIAMRLALQPYLEGEAGGLLSPLPQETDLANLLLYSDFYPQDGQLTLIEQLRDVITEHIPQEEREWLDPLKHSYLDLAEFLSFDEQDQRLVFRSIGDARVYRVPDGAFRKELQPGQVLFTRLIREPGDVEWERAIIAGAAIVLSNEDGKGLLMATRDYQRQVEITAGSFELGDWQEFAKRYGHVLLWTFARMRFAALIDAVKSIHYVGEGGKPYLYALALYDHCEYGYMVEMLAGLEGFEREATLSLPGGVSTSKEAQHFVQRGASGSPESAVAVRLILTATQLWVECDSRERFDAVKHKLAAMFGFSLHFRGEISTPPPRQLKESELAVDGPLTLVISAEEDRAFLNGFLETLYLEWAERACPSLDNQMPRHVATSAAGREQVAALIADMERHDPGTRRVGQPSFDYNRLRAHVGLD
ncbi:MAG: hypothetical protein CAF43_003445 [Nitrospira sp. CG24C]|nr:MAG: hypothetical protein CAF43_003445 [Nitrospira sp. CG24C]